jgi:hypothetical protein
MGSQSKILLGDGGVGGGGLGVDGGYRGDLWSKSSVEFGVGVGNVGMTLDIGNVEGKSKTGLGGSIEFIETKATWEVRTGYFQNVMEKCVEKNKNLERQFF